MQKYLIKKDGVTVLDIHESLPFSLDGVSYPANWLKRGAPVAGHTVEPYQVTPPPPPVPSSVTKLQLVRTLRAIGQWGAAKSALNAAPADTQEDWELAVTVNRHDPIVVSMGQGLGLSETDLDDVFIDAATR